MQLDKGQRINAPFLPCAAEVLRFEPRAGYALLQVVLQDGQQTFRSLTVTDDQLAAIEVLSQDRVVLAENAEDFFFFVEANRIRLAYQFDPHLAISVSQVDPLPHQIEAVYHYALQFPRLRFLIADDPGAGKTIMAGLILKELQYRRLARRILIVAPGHLKYQWQREMKDKFQTSFVVIDRARMDSAWGENAWEEADRCITSLDFIKQDEIRSTLASTSWDLVIVDEAHKMAAYAYEGKEGVKVDKTRRYQAGEILSRSANHLLFLTATPHKGDEENFGLFLDLLRPGFFAQAELLKESVANQDNPVFVRRLKEDMCRFDGSKIFPPRHVQSVKFPLTPAELTLYNGVTRYVQDDYDRAKENRSISFALMILQRRLTSSSHAIYRSLQRRRERLEDLLAAPEQIRQEGEDYMRARRISDDELEDMAEDERAQVEERLENLTAARSVEDVRAELAVLDDLIAQAERVRAQETESKLTCLRDKVLSNLGEHKLLIFTEFRDTLDDLVDRLRRWGYRVGIIHGGMDMDARIQAEHDFKHKNQILVATEAAGEGINLQFCSLMVNYDIPWNPNRLEQRMGRIHRYGQDKEVFIWNMISKDTREGQILDRLFGKLELMRAALGSDRVFDIIGEVIPGARLDELLKDAILNQRRMEEIEEQIEVIDRDSVQQTLDQVFLTSLASRHIDYSGLRQETRQAEENRLVPEYVGDYVVRALRRLGGAIERRELGYAISAVPYELRQWNEDTVFKTTYGKVQREYRRATFDKKVAQQRSDYEFVAPGHPLLEAINETVLRDMAGGYAAFGDPTGARRGVFWFIEGQVTDGAGQPAGRRVFCLYHDARTSEVRRVNPAVLWDHQPLAASDVPPELESLLTQREAIQDYIVTEILLPFRDEIAQRREREARVKEKYGLRSLDYLIQESNQKLLDYELRQAAGEQMDMPMLNERRSLEALEARRRDLEREIRLERNLTVGEPRILGAALVLPLKAVLPLEAVPPLKAGTPETNAPEMSEIVADEYHPHELLAAGQAQINDESVAYESEAAMSRDMRRDAEIEAVGMRVATQYEREHGWHAEDVSSENLGFDLRSTFYNADGSFAECRYIEVKARAQSGAIRLSANEWKMARKFGDRYWLYVVTEAATDAPQIETIGNPAAQFQLDEDIFATGFIIPEDRWRKKKGIYPQMPQMTQI